MGARAWPWWVNRLRRVAIGLTGSVMASSRRDGLTRARVRVRNVHSI